MIQWFTKKKNGRTSESDLSINKTKEGFSMIFRNNIATKISFTGFFEFGISDNKLYFREASEKNGRKFSAVPNPYHFRATFSSPKEIEILAKYEGDYDFEFDENEQCFFVDRRKVK